MNVNCYILSREKLFEKMKPNSICIIWAKKECIRNGDVTYPYRQDSNTLYLTGINAPWYILILHKDENTQCTSLLFSDELSEKEKIWGSMRGTWEEYGRISWINQIYPFLEWENYCKQLQNKNPFYYIQEELKDQIQWEIESEKIISFDSILRELRTIKNRYEIDAIRHAIHITWEAYSYIRNNLQPWMKEYEIEAMIAYIFRKNQATEAFPSIVASWEKSCILHYTQHTRTLQKNDWILIDFWAEYHGYSADITRSFSVWQELDRYNEIHKAVSDIKNYAETLLKPGISISHWNNQVKDFAFTVCRKLWLPINKYTPLSNPYFPHSIGHFLWLDTHDVGNRSDALQEDMIVTCEPGIYIPEEWIGIRIEDDIRITKNGYENLSKTLIK